MIVDSVRIYNRLIPAILNAAEEHITTRAAVIIQRTNYSPIIENTTIKQITEALFDCHFRRQRHKGPTYEEIAKRTALIYNKKKPVNLVGLMFTRKNICPLKRGGGDESVTDLAEVVSLVHLNSFASLINKFYSPGAQFTILSEGKLLAKTFHYQPEKAIIYQNNLREWIKILNLKYLNIFDYYDFLQEKLSRTEYQARQDAYNETVEMYNKNILPVLNPLSLDQTIKKTEMLDLKDDFIPIWKSILNSLPYHFLQEHANKTGKEYDHVYLDIMRSIFIPRKNLKEESLRQQVIEESWKSTIEYISQKVADIKARIKPERLIDETSFRTTINPKPGTQLGILSIKQTYSCVQPWHGIGFLQMDYSGRLNATALSKLELESMQAVPINLDEYNNRPFCYATIPAANNIRNSKVVTFDMSTR